MCPKTKLSTSLPPQLLLGRKLVPHSGLGRQGICLTDPSFAWDSRVTSGKSVAPTVTWHDSPALPPSQGWYEVRGLIL